jgi:outer membrane biosynthesis protein TonB
MKGLVVFTLLAVAGFSQTAEGGKVIHRVIPTYPFTLLAHEYGDVIVGVHINPNGMASDADVVVGPKSLRGASVKAAKQWRWTPTTIDGKPVSRYAEITFHFNKDGYTVTEGK